MRKQHTYFLAILLFALAIYSCQNDEEINNMGYLRMEIATVTATASQTKTIMANYDPKQLEAKIVDANGKVVVATNDHTEWAGKTFNLPAGSYTIQASSYGFDGKESGIDTPYYSGSTTVFIEKGKQCTATVTCTLANVKVTVNFDEAFKEAFQSTVVTVSSAVAGVSGFKFMPGATNQPVYFPVGNLETQIDITNKNGEKHNKSTTITSVKARDHYILNYKLANEGKGSITVTASGDETVYTFSFPVTTEVTTSLAMKDINAWSDFAYVTGYISGTEEGKTLDPAKMLFEYKASNATDWNTTTPMQEGSDFKATLKNLTPNTQYQCRLVYRNGSEEYLSSAQGFKTETQNKIPNLGFDDWYKNGKHYYPNATSEIFWDSGNEGANTITEKNPTRPEETDVIKGKAAKLFSLTTAGKFAAGSLFTGDFGKASLNPLGATLSFGQPFTERPTQLTGYFKYSAGIVDFSELSYVKSGTDRDSCSIYIALTDWTAPFGVNTGNGTFVDLKASSIIAYGELPKDKVSPATTMSAYEKFTIDIKYRDLTRKPTYILIVCSSSKYGDYFTGSTSSVLYLDEFDLIYGEPVTDPDYIK